MTVVVPYPQNPLTAQHMRKQIQHSKNVLLSIACQQIALERLNHIGQINHRTTSIMRTQRHIRQLWYYILKTQTVQIENIRSIFSFGHLCA